MNRGAPGRFSLRGSGADRGLSLVELALSLGLLSIAIVALLSVFSMLISSTSKSTGLTAGVVFAERRLEEALAKGDITAAIETGSQGIYTHDTANGTTYYYTVTATHLADSVVSSLGRAWYLEVETWWWTDAPEKKRATMGKLSTRVGRVVYVPPL